jgi:hypothetical protein
MSVIKTIVRLRKAAFRLDRLLEKGDLLSADERDEIKVMAKRLHRIEEAMIDRCNEVE